MAEYRKERTPLGHECEIREVTTSGMDGRRWHIKAKDRAGKLRTFYLTAGGRCLPQGGSEEQIQRGVLKAVDDELASPRERVAPDYETTALPRSFGDEHDDGE